MSNFPKLQPPPPSSKNSGRFSLTTSGSFQFQSHNVNFGTDFVPTFDRSSFSPASTPTQGRRSITPVTSVFPQADQSKPTASPAPQEGTNVDVESAFGSEPLLSPEERMNRVYGLLEKGDYAGAMSAVEDAFKFMNAFDRSKMDESTKKEFMNSIYYKLVIRLLTDIKKADSVGDIAKSSFLTRLLVEIPCQSKHKLICYRMAINKNMQANNFRLAARLIKVLLPMNLQDMAALEEKLATCETNGYSNLSAPYACLGCGSMTDTSDTRCSFCGQKILFCYQTFEPIKQSPLWQCEFCECTYSWGIGSKPCPYCTSQLHARSASGNKLAIDIAKPSKSAEALPLSNAHFASPFETNDGSDTHAPTSQPASQPAFQQVAQPTFVANFAASFPPVNSTPTAPTSDPLPKKKKDKKDKKHKKDKKDKKNKLEKSKSSGEIITMSHLVPPELLEMDVISKEERRLYKGAMKLADIGGDGFVDGNEAKVFFIRFTVPKGSLSQIWKLSDVDQDAKLNKKEFFIAMHLTMCVMKGMTLPTTLPASLVPKKKEKKPKASADDYQHLHAVLRKCIEYLDRTALDEKGLFRESANHKDMQELKAAFATNKDYDLSRYKDPHTIAGLIKSYFREGELPTVPEKACTTLRNAAGLSNKTDRNIMLKSILEQEMSLSARSIYKDLFAHLNRVATRSFVNMMTPYNLSICWTPTLIRSGSDMNPVVEAFIEAPDQIFVVAKY